MRSYNSKIIPVIRNEIDVKYIEDIDDISDKKFPEDQEIRDTIDAYRKTGDIKYRDTMIYWFSRYVVSIARNYQEQGLPLADLISEGMIGLIDAINQYNTEEATKFITYSNTCISRQMREALDQFNRPVKVPKNIRNYQNKVSERVHKNSLHGKELFETIEESDEREVPFVSNPKLYHRKRLPRSISSDEVDVDPMENSMILSEEISDKLDQEDMVKDINRIFDSLLTEEEKFVIVRFFGIIGDSPLSLASISELTDKPIDRVRRLKTSGLEKLRSKKSFDILSKYL
jgi:RNA polymerase primary sigma factor